MGRGSGSGSGDGDEVVKLLISSSPSSFQPSSSSSSSSAPAEGGALLDRDDDDNDDDDAVDESGMVRPGAFVWALTLCAGVSGLLFGFDTGVISSTLVSISSDLSRPLTTLDKSLITSSTSLFALLFSPLTGALADALGRKPVILAADALFILGALWQANATSVWSMIVGRSIVGAAVGSASFVVPLYIGELSPSPFRGRLVTVSSLFITGGQVVAYVIGWAFSERAGGWRWMVGLGAVPAIIQAGMLVFMPDTPRFLIQRGRVREARVVLSRVYGSGAGMDRLVAAVLRRVEREILDEEQASPSGIKDDTTLKGRLTHVSTTLHHLLTVGSNRRALTIACTLQFFQQACGFNSLMYFSATIFRLVGFESPTLTSLSIAITNFLFTLVAFWTIDRIGRRRILLLSVPVMAAGLACCAVAFRFLDLGDSTPSLTLLRRQPPSASTTALDNAPSPSPSTPWPPLILASMLLYVSAYAIGLGCVPWQQSELFPLSVRALGSALATSTNWASNTLVGLTFLPMMESVSPTGTFALYAVVCVLGWAVVYVVYPETAGLGLEDVGGLLQEGYGVQESVRRFRARKVGAGR